MQDLNGAGTQLAFGRLKPGLPLNRKVSAILQYMQQKNRFFRFLVFTVLYSCTLFKDCT